MTQWLKALAALAEDQGSGSPQLSTTPENLKFFSGFHRHHAYTGYTHIYAGQYAATQKIKQINNKKRATKLFLGRRYTHIYLP